MTTLQPAHARMTLLIRTCRVGCACLALASGLLLAGFSAAAAQGSSAAQEQAAPADRSTVPTREGNIYGHEEHQPTAAEVEKAGGLDAPSAGNEEQVEKNVNDLLRQTNEMDKAADEQAKDFPAGPPALPPSGEVDGK
jgi:hypothetical protein